MCSEKQFYCCVQIHGNIPGTPTSKSPENYNPSKLEEFIAKSSQRIAEAKKKVELSFSVHLRVSPFT